MVTLSRHDNDKRVIKTKKALKNALFKILETKELSDITISELTSAANVNRRTFYTHYRSISDILDEIESDLISTIRGLIRSFDTDDCGKSAYCLFIKLNEVVTGEFDFYFHLMKIDMRGMLISRLKALLGSPDSFIRSRFEGKAAEYGLISNFIAGGFFSLYFDWYYSEQQIPIEDAARIVSKLVTSCFNGMKE